MITDAVGGFLVGLVDALVSVLPAAGMMDFEGFGQAVGAFKAFDSALPVSEVLSMAAMCLTVLSGIFVMRLFLTLYDRLPGKGT